MFAGFAELDQTFRSLFVTRGPDETPAVADVAPTYRVYGPDGAMAHGTGTAALLGDDPGVYAYALDVAASDGYELGGAYRVLIDYSIGSVAYAIEQLFLVS